MSDYPKISIVTPSFNQANFLEETIVSVINQKYEHLEFLVIDGGSSDGSIDILKKYENHLAYWHSRKDDGQSDALNQGFNLATGDFLIWLNSDDVLLPDTLRIVSNYIVANPSVQWISSQLPVFIDEKGYVRRIGKVSPNNQWALNKGLMVSGGPSAFYSRSLFRQSGGFSNSLNYTMDTDLWWKFTKLKAQCHYLPHPFIGFRIHASSKTSSFLIDKKSEIAKKNYLKGHQEHLRMLESNQIQISRWARSRNRLRQLVNGNYFHALFLTQKHKGVHWSSLNAK